MTARLIGLSHELDEDAVGQIGASFLAYTQAEQLVSKQLKLPR